MSLCVHPMAGPSPCCLQVIPAEPEIWAAAWRRRFMTIVLPLDMLGDLLNYEFLLVVQVLERSSVQQVQKCFSIRLSG